MTQSKKLHPVNPPPKFFELYGLTLLFALILLGFVYGAFALVDYLRVQGSFHQQNQIVAREIQEDLNTHQVIAENLLITMDNILVYYPQLVSSSFEAILDRHPNIDTISIAGEITPEELNAFLSQLENTHPNFTIKRWISPKETEPYQHLNNPKYVPLLQFLSRDEFSEELLGADLLSIPGLSDFINNNGEVSYFKVKYPPPIENNLLMVMSSKAIKNGYQERTYYVAVEAQISELVDIKPSLEGSHFKLLIKDKNVLTNGLRSKRNPAPALEFEESIELTTGAYSVSPLEQIVFPRYEETIEINEYLSFVSTYQHRFTRFNIQVLILLTSVVIIVSLILFFLARARLQSELARRQAENEILRLAHFDALTGLANRHHLSSHLEYLIASSLRRGTGFALLFCDLDGFKPINDTHGHELGDSALILVAKKLVDTVRKDDLVARVGGDEFIVVVENIETGHSIAETTEHVASKIKQAVSSITSLEGHTVQMGTSIGVAIFPNDGSDMDSLIRTADHRMYENKRQLLGRN